MGRHANRISVNRILSGAGGLARTGGRISCALGRRCGRGGGRIHSPRLQNASASNTALKFAQVSRVPQSDDGKLSIFSQF